MRLLLDAHVSPAVARQLEREGIEEWAETGRHHAGVVLVDEKTIRRGREELAASLADQPADRVRQPGGGRPPVEKKRP